MVPARNAGMVAVFLVRGPWGVLQQSWPEASAASLVVQDLEELPSLLR